MSAVPGPATRTRSGPVRLRPAPPPAMAVRRARADDYAEVAAQLDRWSRGRFVGAALPFSFFQHFADTSLLLTEAGRVAGVLVGFRSQVQPAMAYVHYVAIAPASRRQGQGRRLYEAFFTRARELGCDEVQTVVPPVNSSLIAFHRQLGFDVVDGGGFHCGIAVVPNFAGPGQHRVLFRKRLPPEAHRPEL